MGGCLSGNYDKKSALDSNKCSTCNLEEFEKRVNPLIDNIKLSKYKRNILKKRYTKLVVFYENYAENTRRKYNLCRIVISVGSMILPTLQTIQNNETVSAYKDEIFWAAIGTSLSVMISNNIISMFSLDRRYIMYAVTAEKLKAVGWKYFELSDMFSNKSHLENWIMFWNEVEKIKKLQVVAEFTDNDDKHHEPAPIMDNNKSESDSDYDSDTPRKSKTPRNNDDFEDENVVINLEEERQKRLKKTKSSFKKNFSKIKDNIDDNIDNNIDDNINTNLEETENKIKSLGLSFKDNMVNNAESQIENEKKNVENVFNNLENTLIENLNINNPENNQDNIEENIEENKIDIKKDK